MKHSHHNSRSPKRDHNAPRWSIATIIAAPPKETATIQTTVVFDCMVPVPYKLKDRCSYVLLPIFMFWYSRFSFRNLKDANLCMFPWCITTSSKQSVPGMKWLSASFHSKCTVNTVNVFYLQVLVIYKKNLS